MPTDYGPTDCPDCGGAGFLPSTAVLTEWRASDIERALARQVTPQAADVQWLLAQVREYRKALNEIVALAHDVHDEDAISMRIRITAGRALGLYERPEVRKSGPPPHVDQHT